MPERTRGSRKRLAAWKGEEAKECSRCRVVKPLEDYSHDRRRLDGRMSRCLTCCAELSSAARQADPERAREKDRSEQRRLRRNARLRERRKNDPEYARRVDEIREQRRQIKKYGITLEVLFVRDEGICHICGLDTTLTDAEIDHVIPVSRGGMSVPENVALAHMSCNRRKSNRSRWDDLRVR